MITLGSFLIPFSNIPRRNHTSTSTVSHLDGPLVVVRVQLLHQVDRLALRSHRQRRHGRRAAAACASRRRCARGVEAEDAPRGRGPGGGSASGGEARVGFGLLGGPRAASAHNTLNSVASSSKGVKNYITCLNFKSVCRLTDQTSELLLGDFH